MEERGEDYVYQAPSSGKCSYLQPSDGELVPSCGVGLAMTYIGIPIDVLREWDDDDVDSSIICVAPSRWKFSARRVLNIFQEHQDRGARYGEALQFARMVS